MRVTDVDGPPAGDLTLDQVWAQAVAGLSDGSLSPQHRAWIALTRPLGLMEDTALLAAPNEFAKDVLDSRLRPVIAEALSNAYGRDIRVAVTVQPAPAESVPPPGQPDGGDDGDERDSYTGAFGDSWNGLADDPAFDPSYGRA
ncbi:MAG: dnaA, partial [Frankiales bacterium]|nr:dnaA [Frankiales bacterium]